MQVKIVLIWISQFENFFIIITLLWIVFYCIVNVYTHALVYGLYSEVHLLQLKNDSSHLEIKGF